MTGVLPAQTSLQTIYGNNSTLIQEVNRYNNFPINLQGISEFVGTEESAWHFIKAIKLISRSQNWPDGRLGADRVISSEGFYNEQIVNAIAGQTPFITDINPVPDETEV